MSDRLKINTLLFCSVLVVVIAGLWGYILAPHAVKPPVAPAVQVTSMCAGQGVRAFVSHGDIALWWDDACLQADPTIKQEMSK